MFNYSPFLNSPYYSLTSFNPPLNPPLNPLNTVVLRGKIYKITPIYETESLNTNNIYIGSTILSLKE